MPAISRPLLIKFHLFLAAFIFPVIVMFCITGALYTWGFKGEFQHSKELIHLEQPLPNDLLELQDLSRQILQQKGLSTPTGNAKIKKQGNSFSFDWSGSSVEVSLRAGNMPLTAEFEIKQASSYRHFVQLHKAKGGLFFKIYATSLAISLLLLLSSGFIMALQMAKLRKLTWLASAVSIALFITMVLLN